MEGVEEPRYTGGKCVANGGNDLERGLSMEGARVEYRRADLGERA